MSLVWTETAPAPRTTHGFRLRAHGTVLHVWVPRPPTCCARVVGGLRNSHPYLSPPIPVFVVPLAWQRVIAKRPRPVRALVARATQRGGVHALTAVADRWLRRAAFRAMGNILLLVFPLQLSQMRKERL